ncbi:MAG: energy transducer TonB [Candidatus Brocadiales bacterium]|nr:energy transducer TonB [Candidatus Brocadiales bacterium]
MHKKNIIIAGLIALSLHAALILISPNVTSEPEVIFRKGESSLKMYLVPSVASTASTKSIDNIKEEVHKIEEKKIDNPEPVTKPEILKIEQVKVEEKVVQEKQETTYSAEYFKTQKEVNSKQPEIQKNNTAAQDSKEITADIKTKGVTMGALVKNVFKPSYPSSCKRQGHEGTTVLAVTILSKGKCGSIEIIQSAGCESLDKAAIMALKKAKYIPAKRLGVPFTTIKKIAFNFKLEDYQ